MKIQLYALGVFFVICSVIGAYFLEEGRLPKGILFLFFAAQINSAIFFIVLRGAVINQAAHAESEGRTKESGD